MKLITNVGKILKILVTPSGVLSSQLDILLAPHITSFTYLFERRELLGGHDGLGHEVGLTAEQPEGVYDALDWEHNHQDLWVAE